MASPQVTSEQVKKAILQVQALSDVHWSMLREPIQLMHAEAWVGPSGSRYAGTLQGQQQQVQSAFRGALDELNHLLASTLRDEAAKGKQKPPIEPR
jgi:hypothetical protein